MQKRKKKKRKERDESSFPPPLSFSLSPHSVRKRDVRSQEFLILSLGFIAFECTSEIGRATIDEDLDVVELDEVG